MNVVLAIALLSTVPMSNVYIETVDIVEINHMYSPQGKIVFTQLIGWELFDDVGYVAQWWHQVRRPLTVTYGQRRVTVLISHEQRVIRVYATTLRETWTQYDPELENRHLIPGPRRGLPVWRRQRLAPDLPVR